MSHIIDLDLSDCFGTVDHALLMKRLREFLPDPILLALIKKYLKASVSVNGEIQPTTSGVPQGGPLSPLLTNIFLDQLDRKLEQHGIRYVRYADDIVAFASSHRTAVRYKKRIMEFLQELKLQINEVKTSIVPDREVEFLGLSFHDGIRISANSIEKFKRNVRLYCRRGSNRSVEKNMRKFRRFVNGWLAHFAYIDAPDQCADIHGWFTDHIATIISGYRGNGADPMLQALPIWEEAYRKKYKWRIAIEGSSF